MLVPVEIVYYRWQRNEDGTHYAAEPEVYRAKGFSTAWDKCDAPV